MSIRLIALLSALAFCACSSTKGKTNQEVAEEFNESENPIVNARLQARVDNIKYQRGVTLITNLERLAALGAERFEFVEGDLRDEATCERAVEGIDDMLHLAALAGVRPSIENPSRAAQNTPPAAPVATPTMCVA